MNSLITFGVVSDSETAKKYYEMSAQLCDSVGQYNLGYYYFSKKNYFKAIEYFELSAKENNADALDCLGYIFYKGIGPYNINYSKAKVYFERSAALDNNFAMNNLGELFYYGYGVIKDYLQAKFYFEKAAKK